MAIKTVLEKDLTDTMQQAQAVGKETVEKMPDLMQLQLAKKTEVSEAVKKEWLSFTNNERENRTVDGIKGDKAAQFSDTLKSLSAGWNAVGEVVLGLKNAGMQNEVVDRLAKRYLTSEGDKVTPFIFEIQLPTETDNPLRIRFTPGHLLARYKIDNREGGLPINEPTETIDGDTGVRENKPDMSANIKWDAANMERTCFLRDEFQGLSPHQAFFPLKANGVIQPGEGQLTAEIGYKIQLEAAQLQKDRNDLAIKAGMLKI